MGLDFGSGSGRENGGMPRKEIYCETCESDQPLLEHEPQQDEAVLQYSERQSGRRTTPTC
jgi:hypothetical protein